MRLVQRELERAKFDEKCISDEKRYIAARRLSCRAFGLYTGGYTCSCETCVGITVEKWMKEDLAGCPKTSCPELKVFLKAIGGS